jgi:hypothetical protein
MNCRFLHPLAWAPAALLGMTGTSRCLAQSPAMRLADQARAQIDALNADSAYKLLEAALLRSTTDRERIRGFTLLAITELSRGNQPAARQAFERAIRLDPALRVDSLAELSSDIPLVFAQARQAIGNVQQAERAADPPPRAALALTVNVAADTMLSVESPRYQIWVQPNARTRVTASVVALDLGNRTVFENAFTSDARRQSVVEWPLRGADGSLMAPGRYRIRVQATDSTTGEMAPVFDRTLRVARAPADTQAHPPALAPSAFVPERGAAAKVKKSALAWGGGLAAMVLVTPMMMGNTTLNDGLSGDPTVYAVAGGVAIATVVNFMRAGRPVVLAENVKLNQELLASDRRRREAVIGANSAARARAPIRVTTESSP